ncbi:MAG: MgPME-cyclase complex family protein [Pseudanabaenaceae cyanobacterium]
MSQPQTYYFVAASRKYLLETEPLQESLEERRRNYQVRHKPIDFWLVECPAFLDAPEFAALKAKIPTPAAAVISTDPKLITWLKLRLEFVARGEFVAPSTSIPDPLASRQPCTPSS